MKPYRVILWGFGALGQANLRVIITRPEFELVGVMDVNESMNGRDAGEILGIAPVGIKVTNVKETMFTMNADCALHTVQDAYDLSGIQADVVHLLESGKNVISSLPHWYPAMYGTDYAKKLNDACRKGGVTLHGTGEHPGFIVERLGVTLTGFCTDIKHIRVQELLDLSVLASPQTMAMAGFGFEPSKFDPKEMSREVLHRYYRLPALVLGKKIFGADPDRIRVDCDCGCITAPEDFELPGIITVKKGTALTIWHKYEGYIDDRLFYTNDEYWYLTKKNSPVEGVKSAGTHVITIEAKPVSIHCQIDAMASFKENLLRREGDPTLPLYYQTGVVMIQAIPIVCAAEPGVIYQKVYAHCTDDFRKLAQA